MAVNLNFRTALSGFHREDVVRYIEYSNSTHAAQVNQLNTELEELRAQLSRLSEKPDLSGEMEVLRTQLTQAREALAAREQEVAGLTADLEAALALADEIKRQQADNAARELAAMELEAYRRAEQAERSAKLRAEQIYQQATGTLAQATTQVDTAAANFRQMAEEMSAQMNRMQLAVESSKNALLDAATTMYSIRPAE